MEICGKKCRVKDCDISGNKSKFHPVYRKEILKTGLNTTLKVRKVF